MLSAALLGQQAGNVWQTLRAGSFWCVGHKRPDCIVSPKIAVWASGGPYDNCSGFVASYKSKPKLRSFILWIVKCTLTALGIGAVLWLAFTKLCWGLTLCGWLIDSQCTFLFLLLSAAQGWASELRDRCLGAWSSCELGAVTQASQQRGHCPHLNSPRLSKAPSISYCLCLALLLHRRQTLSSSWGC